MSNVIAIAAGEYHSLALKRDGTVVAWGSNAKGQTTVPTSATNVVAIAAGWDSSLALKSDGTLVTWGTNTIGGNLIYIPPNLTNVVTITAGDANGIAITADHHVRLLGATNIFDSVIPAALKTPIGVSRGSSDNVAFDAAGALFDWGFDPTPTRGGWTNIVAIASGQAHNVAVGYAMNYPSVTRPSVVISSNAATLFTFINPNALPTGAWFQWGTNTAYGNTTPIVNCGGGPVAVQISALLSSLSPATVYHCRVVATNALTQGRYSPPIYSSDVAFTTQPPSFSISAAPSTSADTITLSFTGPASATYTVYTTTNLADIWQPIGPATNIAPGLFQFSDPFTNGPTRFYRIQWP